MDVINAKAEARRNELRERALMDFKHAMLVCKIMGSKKGTKFDIMKEYDFLWSEEERNKASIDKFREQMLAMCKK